MFSHACVDSIFNGNDFRTNCLPFPISYLILGHKVKRWRLISTSVRPHGKATAYTLLFPHLWGLALRYRLKGYDKGKSTWIGYLKEYVGTVWYIRLTPDWNSKCMCLGVELGKIKPSKAWKRMKLLSCWGIARQMELISSWERKGSVHSLFIAPCIPSHTHLYWQRALGCGLDIYSH